MAHSYLGAGTLTVRSDEKDEEESSGHSPLSLVQDSAGAVTLMVEEGLQEPSVPS